MERTPGLVKDMSSSGLRGKNRTAWLPSFFFLMGLFQIPTKMVTHYQIMGQPFRDALIDGLIASVIYFLLAAMAAWIWGGWKSIPPQ